MTSFSRGSSPHRLRDAYLRPGSFKPGHKKLGGRKKGTPNRISPEHRTALREAADRIGSDGNGKDGEVGYLTWAATRDQRFFYVDMWSRLLDLEEYEAAMRAQAPPPPVTNALPEWVREISQKNKARRSARTKPPRPFIGPRGEPTDLVQGLMRLAVERPQEFLKSYAAVLLTPPKNWRARAARNHGF